MPQLSKARELREERARLAQQASAVLDDATLTVAERGVKFDAFMLDVDRLKVEIDRHERADILNAELRGTGAPPNGQPMPGGGADDPEVAKKQAERYRRVFSNYMKYGWAPRPDRGIRGITDEERSILAPTRRSIDVTAADLGAEYRDMGTGGQGAYPGATGTLGGFFVPVGFTDRVTEAIKYYGPMLRGGDGLPDIMDTDSGQPLPFPTDNDTAIMGELIGENVQVTTGDVTIGQIMIGAYKYSTRLIRVSIELLQDSAFDIEKYLMKKFGMRLGRILNNHFTVGSGVLQPKGIVTSATLGAAAVGSSGNTGGLETGGTSIGSDDTIELEHAVDILYRPNARYMFHDTTLKKLKQVKDKYGRPLWLPGLAVQAPDTINGYPYLQNNDMDQVPTTPSSPVITRKSALFGDLSLYQIRRVKDMTVLRLEERFADYGQVAFLGFARYDGTLLDAGTNPVKYLTNTY